MKLKKLFAGLVASAMAVSTMASMSIAEVSATTLNWTPSKTSDTQTIIQTSTDEMTTILTDSTGELTIVVDNEKGEGQYDMQVVLVRGDNWSDWSTAFYPGTTGERTTLKYKASDLLENWKLKEIPDDAKCIAVQTYAANASLVEMSYTTNKTTDIWIENSDGSFSYDSVDSAMSECQLGKSVKANQLVKATVTATQTAHFTLCGSSSNGWQQKYFEVKANTPTVIEFNPDADVENLQFQSYDVAVGNDVTVSNLTIGENTYKLSAGLNAQEAWIWVGSANKNYHIGRFVFVVKAEDVGGASKAVFKIGDRTVGSTDTYYTAIRTDAITYSVPSDDYVMFVLTANIGDHSLSEYNLSIAYE
ncbi:MAG: hypothetical protein IJ571_10020 [Ruminococcus sp.]|nr:hypothetical protein [Ruminococcus sp.]